jgi:hypothetical protein
MFAKDTLEDPNAAVERDGFLDEIERISAAIGVFDGDQRSRIDAFLAAPGPAVVPEPERLDGFTARDDVDRYAFVAFARRHLLDPAGEGVLVELEGRLPQSRAGRKTDGAAPYLEVELAELPEIAKPKARVKRLSTGEAPLEIARVGEGWLISCTGCGEASAPVQFRWQALDQTVACLCD